MKSGHPLNSSLGFGRWLELIGEMEWVPSAGAAQRLTVHNRKWAARSPTGDADCSSPHRSQPRPASPQDLSRPLESGCRVSRDQPTITPAGLPGHPRGRSDRARARSLLTTPPARAWSQGRDVLGPELLPQPETGLPAPGTPHAPLPASVSLPCTRARRTRVVTRATPDFGRPPSLLFQTPGPYLRRGSRSGSERLGHPRPALCRRLRPWRRCSRAARGGGKPGKGPSQGEAPSSWPGPPLPLQPWPLARARRPSRLPDHRAQKVLLFTWAKPKGEARWGRVARDGKERPGGRLQDPGSERKDGDESFLASWVKREGK